MKTKIINSICGIFMLCAFVSGKAAAQDMQEGPDMRPLVSIDTKSIKNKTDQPRANFKDLIDRLNHELVQTGIYRVMNIEDMEKAIVDSERNSAAADDGGLGTAISSNAYYIRMTVTSYGVSSGRTVNSYDGTVQHKETARVELILTLVNALTAETVASENISDARQASVTSQFGQTQSGNYKEQALQASCQAVCKKIVQMLVKHTPFYVLDVDGAQITTDIPPSVAKIGALYDVFKLGKAIRNRRTGKIIRSEKKIGTIQLISVSEDFSTGRAVETSSTPITSDCILKPAVRMMTAPKRPMPPSAVPF